LIDLDKIRFPSASSQARISCEFGLRYPLSQDWEVENASAERIEEFLDGWEGQLSEDDRFALFMLLVASAEERLEGGGSAGDWLDRILALGRANPTYLPLAFHMFGYAKGGEAWNMCQYLKPLLESGLQ